MKKVKLLMFGLLLAASVGASAGNVKMKTSKPAGSTISIAVNAGIPITLTWSDGSTESVTSTGKLQDFVVKSESLTIESEKDITALYVAENQLTELNVTGCASTLRKLFCAGNELSSLLLTGCYNLVALDCQGNKLSTLSVPSTKMQDVNVADNSLATHGLIGGTNIVSLVCANNRMSNVNSLSSMVQLTSLFCQGNQISTLSISKCVNLLHVLAYDNKLKAFSAKPLTKLEDLWIGNNELTELDLSANTALVGLVAENNQLASLTWDRNVSRTFKYADLSGNELFFNSFPTIYNPTLQTYTIDGTVAPQNPTFLFDELNVGQATSTDFQRVLSRNGWNTATGLELTITDDSGSTLESGVDYTLANSRLTFLGKARTGVVISATSRNYPDVVLKTKPFNVVDPTGIELPGMAEGSDAATPVYDLQGRKYSDASALPKGVYIVKGKKIVVR